MAAPPGAPSLPSPNENLTLKQLTQLSNAGLPDGPLYKDATKAFLEKMQFEARINDKDTFVPALRTVLLTKTHSPQVRELLLADLPFFYPDQNEEGLDEILKTALDNNAFGFWLSASKAKKKGYASRGSVWTVSFLDGTDPQRDATNLVIAITMMEAKTIRVNQSDVVFPVAPGDFVIKDVVQSNLWVHSEYRGIYDYAEQQGIKAFEFAREHGQHLVADAVVSNHASNAILTKTRGLLIFCYKLKTSTGNEVSLFFYDANPQDSYFTTPEDEKYAVKICRHLDMPPNVIENMQETAQPNIDTLLHKLFDNSMDFLKTCMRVEPDSTPANLNTMSLEEFCVWTYHHALLK